MNGVVVNVLVGDPIVLDCSDAGCAANLIACFQDTLGVDADMWLKQLTGGAFDGQYFNLNVPQHMCSQIKKAGHEELINPNPTWDAESETLNWEAPFVLKIRRYVRPCVGCYLDGTSPVDWSWCLEIAERTR